MEWITKIIEIIKLPVKIIVGIAMFAGSLLIMPESLITKLRLQPFLENYGLYLGIAFYAAVILILTNIAYLGISLLRKRLQKKQAEREEDAHREKLEKRIAVKIESLDPHEKALLREFVIQAKNTLELPLDDPIVAGLIHLGILVDVGQYSSHNILLGVLSSVSISEIAYKHLTPERIGLPQGEPTPNQKKAIISQRPEIVLRIERFNQMYKR